LIFGGVVAAWMFAALLNSSSASAHVAPTTPLTLTNAAAVAAPTLSVPQALPTLPILTSVATQAGAAAATLTAPVAPIISPLAGAVASSPVVTAVLNSPIASALTPALTAVINTVVVPVVSTVVTPVVVAVVGTVETALPGVAPVLDPVTDPILAVLTSATGDQPAGGTTSGSPEPQPTGAADDATVPGAALASSATSLIDAGSHIRSSQPASHAFTSAAAAAVIAAPTTDAASSGAGIPAVPALPLYAPGAPSIPAGPGSAGGNGGPSSADGTLAAAARPRSSGLLSTAGPDQLIVTGYVTDDPSFSPD
jgi:S-DNA-T family DNA segregation ATPase FtsK/SpoIIIE